MSMNSKPEFRIPNSERNPKLEARMSAAEAWSDVKAIQNSKFKIRFLMRAALVLNFAFFILNSATARAAAPPTIQSVQPPPGTVTTLAQVTVTFSAAVTNVVATDLRANDDPASEVTGSGAVYTFTLGRQPDYGIVQFTWDPSHGIRDQDTPPNRFDETAPGSTWQYTFLDTSPPIIASRTPQEGVSVRSLTQIEVLFSEAVSGVDPADLRINGVPASGLSVPGARPCFHRVGVQE
jgi:hypothetical protein